MLTAEMLREKSEKMQQEALAGAVLAEAIEAYAAATGRIYTVSELSLSSARDDDVAPSARPRVENKPAPTHPIVTIESQRASPLMSEVALHLLALKQPKDWDMADDRELIRLRAMGCPANEIGANIGRDAKFVTERINAIVGRGGGGDVSFTIAQVEAGFAEIFTPAG